MQPRQTLTLAAVLASLAGCGDSFGPADSPAVSVAPGSATLVEGDTLVVTASLRDSAGNPVDGAVTWTSSNPTVASVAPIGSSGIGEHRAIVRAAAPGTVTITAQRGAARGTASITVMRFASPQGMLVSDPGAFAGPGAVGPQRAVVPTLPPASALIISDSTADSVVHVALAPGTAPAGISAAVRVVRSLTSVTVAVINGGFDPVPVVAQTGDSIELRVTDAADAVVASFGIVVRASRPPIVVRTDPPRRKRDVPLNSVMVIVFSEPVSPTSLATSVQLFQGTNTVSGSVVSVTPDGILTAFVPATPLRPNTDYRLVVTQGVTDLDGQPLEGGVTVDFTTGQSSTGPPASVTISPASVTMVALTTYRMTAIVRDSRGNVLLDQLLTWSTSDSTGLAIGSTEFYAPGTIRALRAGSYEVVASTNGVTGRASVIVTSLSFMALDAGARHTCALSATGGGWCWGGNQSGQLGDYAIPHPLDFSVRPVAVAGALTLQALGAAGSTVCGLATNGAAWCWGDDVAGQLGAGGAPGTLCGNPCAPAPLAVVGGHTFTSIGVGWQTSCALTTTGAAYCWGNGVAGQLGIGSTSGLDVCRDVYGNQAPCSRTPLAVAGGHTFTSMVVGGFHACALTTSGAAYCWGENAAGQLGVGTDSGPDLCGSSNSFACSRTPVPVAGGLTFTALRVSLTHTCGKTPDGSWYCWGSNNYGQLGTGVTGPEMCYQEMFPCSTVPLQVSVGTFATVLPGTQYACGITAAGAASCWGRNVEGQLGNGTNDDTLVPVAIAGGLTFASVSPEQSHTCGVTAGGIAYCWGANAWGQLGNNSRTSSTVPVPVSGQTIPGAAAAVRPEAIGRMPLAEPELTQHHEHLLRRP